MAGLQRSVETFRRSGSSGLVWEDRFLSESNEPKDNNKEVEGGLEVSELRPSNSVGPMGMLRRSGSAGAATAYRTGRVSPAIDPPSPTVSGCGFCGIFGKSFKQHKHTGRR